MIQYLCDDAERSFFSFQCGFSPGSFTNRYLEYAKNSVMNFSWKLCTSVDIVLRSFNTVGASTGFSQILCSFLRWSKMLILLLFKLAHETNWTTQDFMFYKNWLRATGTFKNSDAVYKHYPRNFCDNTFSLSNEKSNIFEELLKIERNQRPL